MTTIPPASGKTTPRDFFLWVGAVIALYGSVIAFISLLFEYVNQAFPDALAGYGDPYGGAARTSMATLIVLVPMTLVLLRLIRRTIVADESKAGIWIRRWALVLTLFIAGATVAIDLITLINTFLGGELTTRFVLKVAIVLLIALGVSFHFFADLKGWWLGNIKKANAVGIAVMALTILTIAAGFVIIGTPQQMRSMRYDAQKVSDLQNVQYQVLNYWQTKKTLPRSLADLSDSFSGNATPNDPQTGASYRYVARGPLSFTLCANFNLPSTDTAGQGAYPISSYPMAPDGLSGNDTWEHGTGETCFSRTIDPARYPTTPKPL